MKIALARICSVVLLTAMSVLPALGAKYDVKFEAPIYHAVVGKPTAARVIISPVPPAGLFSYGVTISIKGRSLGGDILTPGVPPELDFHTVRGAGAEKGHSGAVAFAKGSVDITLDPIQPYKGSVLAGVAIAGLPQGEYTLTVTSKNDLGPTEQIFVDGQNSPLDSAIEFNSAKLIVEKGQSLAGPVLLNRQTGLFEQRYTLINSSEETEEGLRVYLDNIPDGVTVWNAWNARVDPSGRPYVVYTGDLAPGASVNLTIEYDIPGRRILPKTEFSVGNPANDVPTDPGSNFIKSTSKKLPNGQILLEFDGALGDEYYIQYSYDQSTWITVMPPIPGLGSLQQWVDNGPPKTDSPPQSAAKRYYRVVEVAH